MKVLYEKKFLKDIDTVNEKHVEMVISEIEKPSTLSNLKKMKGHKSAYRIRIGNYRVGFIYENQTVIFLGLLNRKDIYKYFP